MNGLFPGGSYFTIHVTPQPSCSYASFETNVREEDYTALLNSVLEVFSPAKFMIVVTATSTMGFSSANFGYKLDRIGKATLKERQFFASELFSLSMGRYDGQVRKSGIPYSRTFSPKKDKPI